MSPIGDNLHLLSTSARRKRADGKIRHSAWIGWNNALDSATLAIIKRAPSILYFSGAVIAPTGSAMAISIVEAEAV